MVRLLRLCLTALALVLVAAGGVASAAKKPPKCAAGKAAPASTPALCVKLGAAPASLPTKGLPKRQAALVRRARAGQARLQPMLASARRLLEDGSLRRHAAAKPRGRARAAGLGARDSAPLGELDPRFGNVDAVMSGRPFAATEGRVGGGAPAGGDRRGRKGTVVGVGLDDYGEGDRCPSAAGLVHGDFVVAARQRAGSVQDGRRYNLELEFKQEGRYTGHVGRGARAETVDFLGSGVARIRVWEDDPKTGRVLAHHPTRTFRATLDVAAWPVDRKPDASVVRGMQLRGPGGDRYRGPAEREGFIVAVQYAAMALSHAAHTVKSGDTRWYDEMACAKADLNADRAAVRAGDRVQFAGRTRAADGTPADADWNAATECAGRLDPATARGAEVTFALEDVDRAWRNGSGACMTAEVLGPAGRARISESVASAVDRFRITFTGEGSHTRDFQDDENIVARHQVDTFSWRIVFDDVRIDGQPYGNVVPTDVSGLFDFGGHFGTATFGCSGDLKAYSGEGQTPLGSIMTAPSGDATTLKLSAFARIDPQAPDCAAESIANVAPDGGPGPYGVSLSFKPGDFVNEERRKVGGKAIFPPDCGEPAEPGFTCKEDGEWSGEVLIQPARGA